MLRSSRPSAPSSKRRRPSAALVVASLALVVAAAPPAYAAIAANSVGTAQIVNGSVSAVDIRPGAISSSKVTDSSLVLADLADAARWRQTSTGSWSRNNGIVQSVPAAPGTLELGSLGNEGSGVLRLTRSTRILVVGSMLAQNFSGTTKRIDCNVLVNGTAVQPDATALVPTSSSQTIAVSASKAVTAGAYDVSLACSGPSSGMTAGNVRVNVVAVPLD